jgi:predicted amidohydrolase YtcJ
VLFTGGRVHAAGLSDVTAIVTDGATVSYLGTDDEARRQIDGSGIDLAGRLVTPAFVDAHLHTIQTGQVMIGIDLHGAASRSAVLDHVRTYARRHPAAGVIVGQGWDERDWADPRPPTRAELDRAGGGLPVYLARVDVHSAVISSALLAELPEVAGAAGYREDGLVTQEAHHLCRGRMDRLFTDAERRDAARSALQRVAAQGVATVHELGGPHLGPLADLERVREVADELGLTSVRYWGELASPSALERARRVGAAGLAGDLCVDGAIGSRTAALNQPYADADHCGRRYLDDEEILQHLLACTRAGLQAGFHVIGDDAVSAAVQGLRRAAEILGGARIRAARHRLEHLEMIAPADFDVLADLGVVASVQPAFDAAWGGPGELYQARLGKRRAAGMNPFGSLGRAGVVLAFGTDAPVTAPAGWAMVRDAVRHHRPDEQLTVVDAFGAATRGGHRAAGDDDAGVLRVGSRADLAVWDVEAGSLDRGTGLPRLERDDPLPVCVATLAGGSFVHRTGPLAVG